MEQRWIPVSERLPEERDSIFAKWKGTAKWNPAMFEKTSDEVLVTISDEGGKRTTRTAHTLDGKWSCDLLKANASYKVIAWMPLPEPYREGEPKQTNADRIRSMTDEELAGFIAHKEFYCEDYCEDAKQGCSWSCDNKGKKAALAWLQKESEE